MPLVLARTFDFEELHMLNRGHGNVLLQHLFRAAP